jgi:hypothetical protein
MPERQIRRSKGWAISGPEYLLDSGDRWSDFTSAMLAFALRVTKGSIVRRTLANRHVVIDSDV